MRYKLPIQYALLALDKLNFIQLTSSEFVKSVQDGNYPRLHAILEQNGSETEIDIHLDLEKHKNSIQDSHLIRQTINKIKEVIN
jgi:hypothetical protein